MTRHLVSVVAACVLALAAWLPAAAEVVLAAGGSAQCTVVVGREDGQSLCHAYLIPDAPGYTQVVPTEVLKRSAADLAHYLNRLMGGPGRREDLVRVVEDKAQARTPCRILLGTAAIEEHGLQAEAAKLSYAGYVYRTVGNDLLIFGAGDKGTANGVYGFLQDELGIRWFGPQDEFTVVPRRDRVAVGALDRRVEPSFHGRLGHNYGRLEDLLSDWGRRIRCPEVGIYGVGGNEPFSNASHNMDHIFRPDVYYKNHPEYYALASGRRQDPTVYVGSVAMCWSNPEVIRIATEAALSYFRANKFHHSFSLGINDGNAYCECEQCVKWQPQREFRGVRVASDMYYAFVNEVARRVAREFPDRYLGAIAYNDVTAPPVRPMEKNVFVVLVNDISEYYDSAYRKQDEELVRAWQEKGSTLGMYYYTGSAKLVPAHFPRLLAQELKDKHARGFRALISETNPGWPWNGPMAYVESRLWWDVNLDVNALLDDYFTSLFGPAAKPMSRLYALFEQIHMRPRRGGFLHEHYKFLQFRPYTGADLALMRQYLAEAHSAVADPTMSDPGLYARRVAYVSNGLQVFLEMLEGTVLARELGEAGDPVDDVAALVRLEQIGRLTSLMQRHDALYRETIVLDRFQSTRYTRDRCTPVRTEWRAALQSALIADLVRLRLWTKGRQVHALVRARLNEVLAYHMQDPIGRATVLVKCGEAHLGPNLVGNPGFEEPAAGAAPDAPDVAPAGADKWGLYPGPNALSRGRIEVVSEGAFAGRRAGRVTDVLSGNFNSMVMPVKPGQLYLFSAMARCSAAPGEQTSSVSISHLWTKPGGGWDFGLSSQYQYAAELHSTDQWEKLETVVLIPEGAGGIALMLNARNLTGGQQALFDDVSFRLISLPEP